ncbi:CotH kinase family protein [Tumebacillus flagellatus]|uniref:Spore coat protein n=1 Tax=Tumebacillus flagellatus TaxID=1157490 RepID=A0A074LI10_9BACL|nr:CotH kinase family protein [Tumebacillus flagellatus]KEO81871.1 hypothetical protein EL26_18715 [Tumebacillus flagellatus]
MSRDPLPEYALSLPPSDLQSLLDHPKGKHAVPALLQLSVLSPTFPIRLSLRGSHTRRYPKKSFRIELPAPHPTLQAREFHLNAEYADPAMIRNKLSFAFFERLGALTPDAQYVKLLLNGTPAGAYLHLESVDDLYLKKRNLPPGPIFYAVNNNANFSLISKITQGPKAALEAGYEGKVAAEHDWASLREWIYFINTTPADDFARGIPRYLDLDAYFNWLAGVVCTQNFDGFIQNYALYQNGETGLFQLIPWDYDGTWGRNLKGKPLRPDYIPITGYNTLTARMLADQTLRARYRVRMEEVLATHFTPRVLEPLVQDLLRTVRPALEQDPHRNASLPLLDGEFDVISTFVAKRRRYLLDHLRDLE